MKKFLKFILSPFLGKRRFQGLFHLLYQFSLKGLNYGGGADFRASGEERALKYAASKTAPGGVFVIFDVGANEGGYALAAREIVGHAKIYAFEPAPHTFHKLKAVSLAAPNIEVFNLGLGAKNQPADLRVSESASGLTSLYDREVFKRENFPTFTVRINLETVDDFCARHSVSRINFLKLDVEGHELEVLKGARQMLAARKIDFVQFEFGGTDVDARVFLKDFFNLLRPDYIISRILQDGLGRLDYDESKEIFTTTNYLAELKK